MGAGLEKHDAEVRLTGVSQVTVQFANQRWVYGIDPDAGARISTIEGFAATQTTPFSKTEYHYVEDGATFTPRQVVRSKTDPTSPGEYYTVSVYLSEIVGEVPDDSFGLDVLDVCDGARILDRRRDAETAVRSFSPSVAASQAAGSIAAQVAAMPVRRAGHNDTEVDIAVHSEHSGWRWYLIGANAVTIILVSAFWLISRRK